MTGLHADQTRVRSNSVPFRKTIPSVKTIPRMFHDKAYFMARVRKT